MGKIRSFNYISADGFYAGPNDDLSWFTAERRENDALQDFSHLRLDALNTLIFGRITYEMMRDYWSTPDALEDDPRTTFIMRESPKLVFSKTLAAFDETPSWMNVTVLRTVDPGQIRQIRDDSGRDMTILGSGTILRQFFDLGLLDEVQLTEVPKSIRDGKTLLSPSEINSLSPTITRVFESGFISRTYVVQP